MTWALERVRTSPGAFHHRAIPDPATRAVWVAEPTVAALVLGSAQPDSVADRVACERAGIEVVRRRSGGGAVLVVPGEVLWVDVVLGADDPLWQVDVGRAFHWLGESWSAALADVGVAGEVHRGGLEARPWSSLVCFAGLGPGEVTAPTGEKLVGMAQRRTRGGARFQCAVLAHWDPVPLLGLLALAPEARAQAATTLADAAHGVGAERLEPLLDALVRRLP